MTSLTVSLPDALRDWLESRVESGQYSTPGEYVRELIDRDRTDAEERDAIIAALVEGEQSGLSERSVPDILAALRRERGEAA